MKRLSCRQILIALLSDPGGCTTSELAAALSWRPASVRAEISRLRKAGWLIRSEIGAEGQPRRTLAPQDAIHAYMGEGSCSDRMSPNPNASELDELEPALLRHLGLFESAP